jgi:hypothetical protein
MLSCKRCEHKCKVSVRRNRILLLRCVLCVLFAALCVCVCVCVCVCIMELAKACNVCLCEGIVLYVCVLYWGCRPSAHFLANNQFSVCACTKNTNVCLRAYQLFCARAGGITGSASEATS